MASNASPVPQDQEDEDDQGEHYEQRHPRINKPDMFMNTALWMERSPLAKPPNNFGRRTRTPGSQTAEQEDDDHDERQPLDSLDTSSSRGKPVHQETACRDSQFQEEVRKAGAVFVLPNDRALSVDCSQNGVHAAVSALNKFGQERAKGCQVYLSRRPCSYCAKLLVQCEVAKVFYLPIEPEWKDPEDIRRVDNIFKASSTGLSNFIPRVRPNVIDELKNRPSPFVGRNRPPFVGRDRPRNEEAIIRYKNQLVEEYLSDDWINFAGQVLEWPAFTDKMKQQTMTDMCNLLEWIARATFGDVPDDIQFAEIDPNTMKAKRENVAAPSGDEDAREEEQSQPTPEIPTSSDAKWQEHALHMCRLAQMLSQRSDDPTRRVGCVLMLRNEVVAIGWNGFPAKSLYGEFPRASSTDRAKEKKEPYVIHAEQNALLTRNKRNMKHDSSILFCNIIPAPECVPMLIQAGVKNVLVPLEDPDHPQADNKVFFDALQHSKLVGFWPKEEPAIANPARRNRAAEL